MYDTWVLGQTSGTEFCEEINETLLRTETGRLVVDQPKVPATTPPAEEGEDAPPITPKKTGVSSTATVVRHSIL